DTFAPLTVPAWFGSSAFTIFLLRQFFMTIPRDLDDAARVDGAGSFRILWSIIVPLSRPALATVMILQFLSHWNDFLGPFIYLNNKSLFTMSLGLRYFQTVPEQLGEPKEHLLDDPPGGMTSRPAPGSGCGCSWLVGSSDTALPRRWWAHGTAAGRRRSIVRVAYGGRHFGGGAAAAPDDGRAGGAAGLRGCS